MELKSVIVFFMIVPPAPTFYLPDHVIAKLEEYCFYFLIKALVFPTLLEVPEQPGAPAGAARSETKR